MGWGHPNTLLAEPGIQAVLFRTSVNIWHEPTVQLFCDKNGQGKYKALALGEACFQHAPFGLTVVSLQKGYRNVCSATFGHQLLGTPHLFCR